MPRRSHDGDTSTPTPRVLKVCVRCGTRSPFESTLCPVDGEALTYDPETLVGLTLDGTYRIERQLGTGGMGVVYLARHALLEDRVAVKVMSAKLVANAGWMRRFLREGRAARAIRHPSVVKVHDLRRSSEGIAYLVMEYVDGRTLRSVMDESGALSISKALSILEPVAEALDEAHGLGIVHRDLKPSNVMLGSTGDHSFVKLMDLGVAKLLDPDDASNDLTGIGEIIGTPRYMAPEQCEGSPEVDKRTDVYSLGVMVYEMLAGQAPFESRSPHALMLAHLRSEPKPLCLVNPRIPAQVSDAVMRALAKAPSERPASAGELVSAIAAYHADAEVPTRTETVTSDDVATPVPLPATDRVEPPAPESTPATRRPRAPAAAIAIAAVGAISLATAGLWVTGGSWLGAREAPVAPAPVAERSLAFVLTVQKYRDGRPEGAPFASDGRNIFEENFRVRLRIDSPQPGALVVLNEAPEPDPATGLPRYTVLFPDPATNGGSSFVAVGRGVQVPAEDWIWFDDETGAEKLWIIWSARPLDALVGLEQTVNPRDAGAVASPEHAARIRDLLAAHAAAPRDVRTDDATRVTTVRAGGDVLVHALRLEHR